MAERQHYFLVIQINTQASHTLAVGIPGTWPLAAEWAKVECSLPERFTWPLQMWPLELSGPSKPVVVDSYEQLCLH